jgi:hypothetical protein
MHRDRSFALWRIQFSDPQTPVSFSDHPEHLEGTPVHIVREWIQDQGPRPLLRHAVILHWIAIAMWTSGAFEAVRSSRFESRHSGNECLQRIPWKSLNDPTQLHLIQSSRHLLMSSTNIRPRQEKSRKSRRASDSYRLVGQSPPKASLSYTPPSSTLDVMVIAPFCFASITCRLASPGNPCNSGLQNTPLLLVAIPDERPTYLPA